MMARARPAKKVEAPPEVGFPVWVLSMGDMFSQLMVFFVLLFSVSDVKQKKIDEVFQSFRAYFNADGPIAGPPQRTFEEALRSLDEMSFDIPDTSGEMGSSRIAVEERFGKYIAVEAKDERVTLTIAAELLFPEGSAALQPGGDEKVGMIAEKLIGYWTRVKVVGHCSPLPLSSGSPFADHLSLGYARAKAVADSLAAHWGRRGRPEEAQRIEVATRGKNDPPRDWTDESKYDRVEVVVTPEPVLRRATLKQLGGGERTAGEEGFE